MTAFLSYFKSSTIKNICLALVSSYIPHIVELAYIWELIDVAFKSKLDQTAPILSAILTTLFSGLAFKHRVNVKTKL